MFWYWISSSVCFCFCFKNWYCLFRAELRSLWDLWCRCSPAGEQRRGSAAARSVHQRAGSRHGRAPGDSGLGPGGVQEQERGGPVRSGPREAGSAGAGGSDGVHPGAAQGDGRPLLCAGGQGYTQQVLLQINNKVNLSWWVPLPVSPVAGHVLITSLCLLIKYLHWADFNETFGK